MIIDLDKKPSAEQQQLVKGYYQGYIPHVAVLDGSGHAVYNVAGEVSDTKISEILDRLLAQSSR